ncbi:MAG: hypothetical protein HYZ14_01860 [Bacteroidetes bacterium]|nr:hypothetical protein [Bacteroidota bacterium]
MMQRTLLIVFFLLGFLGTTCAQKGVTTFGLQYKPIIPNRFIGTYQQDFNEAQLQSSIQQKLGHSFGGVIRHGFTKNLSFETGLNITYRNFGLNFSVPDSGYAKTSSVSVVSYEVPLSCLVYIQLSDKWFINTSLGSALTIFTSDVYKPIPIVGKESFRMEGAYQNKIQGALLANVGFEFRSRKSGYYYIGTSYHLPFAPIITMAMSYEYDGGDVVSISNVRGSYLTLDFRYFFHERPEADNQ